EAEGGEETGTCGFPAARNTPSARAGFRAAPAAGAGAAKAPTGAAPACGARAGVERARRKPPLIPASAGIQSGSSQPVPATQALWGAPRRDERILVRRFLIANAKIVSDRDASQRLEKSFA